MSQSQPTSQRDTESPQPPEPEQRRTVLEDEDIDRYLATSQSFSEWSDPGPTIDELYGPQDCRGKDTAAYASQSGLGPSRSNDAVTAGRLARRRKLHPYQITEVESLAKSSLSTQLLHLVVEQFATRNRLEEFLSCQPPFEIKKPLADTISSYVLAVLMSEHIGAYKGNMPTDCVVNLIIKNNVNVPTNLTKNPYALNLVKTAAGDELTQARARIKRFIGESITKDWSILDLALKVVEGSQINASAATCARLAIMRKVYSRLLSSSEKDKVGSDYWDKVDERLRLYRSKANNKPQGVQKILVGILDDDKKKYGLSGPDYSIPGSSGHFQEMVDDMLAEGISE